MCFVERNFLKVLLLVGFVLIVAIVSLAFSRSKDKTRPSRYYLAHKKTTPKPPIIRFPIENSTVYNQLEHVDGLINKWIRKKPLYRELKKCRRTLIKYEWNLAGPSQMNFLIPTTTPLTTIPTSTPAEGKQNYETQNGTQNASQNSNNTPSPKDISKYKKEMAKKSSKNGTNTQQSNESNKDNVMPDDELKKKTNDTSNGDNKNKNDVNKQNKNGTDANVNGDNFTNGYSSTTEGPYLLNAGGDAYNSGHLPTHNDSKSNDNKYEYYHSNETEGIISIKGNSVARNMLDILNNLSEDVDEDVATTRKPVSKKVKKMRKYSIVSFFPATTTKKVPITNGMMAGGIL